MSRTVRAAGIGRHYYNREAPWVRRMLHRKYRAQERDAITTERFDGAPQPKGTQGWFTW